MKMTQLSVSSVILAAVLSGCSQQVTGGSQISAGSQQTGGSQVSTGSQQTRGSQVSTGSQSAGGSQVMSQRQNEGGSQTIAQNVYKPATPKAKKVYHKRPRPAHSVRKSGLPAAQPG